MTCDKSEWLDALSVALADARAVLACFGTDEHALAARIDDAMAEAQRLKSRAVRLQCQAGEASC